MEPFEGISSTYSEVSYDHSSDYASYEQKIASKSEAAQLTLKDLTDKSVAGTALLLLSPLLLLIAALIKLESKGPIFFTQTRGGKDCQEFTILKFRTMTHDACKSSSTEHAKKHDPRMTKMGKILRKTSLDELPQILNVLRGDMSLVGPRPHMVEHDALYRKEVTAYDRRFRMKPGITGLAQVNGRRGMIYHANHMQSRIDDDNDYIDNWNYMQDIKILIKTPWIVLTGKNAH